MQYPKHLYKKSANKSGFETVIVKSEAEHEALDGEHFESPADLGIETHPNPDEAKVKPKAAKAEVADEEAPVVAKKKPKAAKAE